MAYIKRVKNTANQHFDLHDARLDDGTELSIAKDWAVNDTESSKYITNRTHYTNNRFELVYPTWNGSFSDNEAPNAEEIVQNSVNMLFYKLTNIPISNTIQNANLEDIIVYYKPSSGLAQNTKTMAQLFDGETIEIQSSIYLDIDEYVEQVEYGTTTNSFIIYNVTAPATVTIGNKELELTAGIYSIGKASLLEEDIHPIKKTDQVVKIDIKYIPDEIINSIGAIPNTYATKTYVDNAVAAISIPDISGKMDKNSPIGYGDFYLLPNDQNLGGRAIIGSDIYANFTEEYSIYDSTLEDFIPKTRTQVEALLEDGYTIELVSELPAQGVANKVYKIQTSKKVATEDWVNQNKMPINQTDFTALTINSKRVLTSDDLGDFKGFYADVSYLPILDVLVGDYAYVLNAYVNNGHASIKRYVYTTNGQTNSWVADQSNLAADTFTQAQWKNINTDPESIIAPYISRITQLETDLADLVDICNTMFEFAEGKEF